MPSTRTRRARHRNASSPARSMPRPGCCVPVHSSPNEHSESQLLEEPHGLQSLSSALKPFQDYTRPRRKSPLRELCAAIVHPVAFHELPQVHARMARMGQRALRPRGQWASHRRGSAAMHPRAWLPGSEGAHHQRNGIGVRESLKMHESWPDFGFPGSSRGL